MNVSCRLHVCQNVILKVLDGLVWIRNVLILLNITNYIGGLGSLGEVDQVGTLDHRRDPILDERQISQVDP